MSDELRGRLEAMSTEDLCEILRGDDREVWRPEVFPLVEQLLRARSINVLAVKADEPPVSRLEYGALTKVASTSDPRQGNLCRMALLEAGLEAWLATEYLAGALPSLGLALGVDVLVRHEDAAAARELLARLDAGAAEIRSEPER